MKIRLSESQYEMLLRLNESKVDLSGYYNKMDRLIKEVNALYNKLSFSTISEILEGDVDIDIIEKKLNEIDDIKHKLFMNAYSMIERIPEDEYMSKGYDYDAKIDLIDGKLGKKINTLNRIISHLHKIKEDNDNSEIEKVFSDIKRMEIETD